MQLLQQRLATGKASGEKGYILDGFPRTRAQVRDTGHQTLLLPHCLLPMGSRGFMLLSIPPLAWGWESWDKLLPLLPLSSQAEKLAASQRLQVAFNLGLREEVLVEKCLGEAQAREGELIGERQQERVYKCFQGRVLALAVRRCRAQQ